MLLLYSMITDSCCVALVSRLMHYSQALIFLYLFFFTFPGLVAASVASSAPSGMVWKCGKTHSLTVFIVMYVAIRTVVNVDLFYWVNKEAN